MNRKNDLLEYLRGNRKGKLANRLERDALSDPFLYETLEGLTNVEGDHLKVITDLDRKLGHYGNSYAQLHLARWGGGVLLVVAAILIVYFLRSPGGTPEEVSIVGNERVATPVASMSVKEEKVVPPEDTTEMIAEEQQVDIQVVDKPSVEFTGTVKVIANNDGPVPVGGFAKFGHYAEESLRYPNDALQNGTEGDVTLSFVINDKGHPSRIRVIKWVSSSLSQEAIRLLDEGPEWSSTDTSVSVLLTIKFSLKK